MRKFNSILVLFTVVAIHSQSHAQFGGGGISLPRSGSGIQGSAGVGYTDFTIQAPKGEVKMERGIYIAGSIERAFDFMHLYLTLGLSHMSANGSAKYQYTNLSSTTTYSADDVSFSAKMTDIAMGLKLKLIDEHWFRPYIEGGGLFGFNEVTYTSKKDVLSAQGNDYKSKDVIMGSGFYAEAGFEIQFGERFGVKLAGRHSKYKTKALETMNSQQLQYNADTFYLSALIGF